MLIGISEILLYKLSQFFTSIQLLITNLISYAYIICIKDSQTNSRVTKGHIQKFLDDRNVKSYCTLWVFLQRYKLQ